MILPSSDPRNIQLVQIPQDMEEHEAYRHATGLIAVLEEESPQYTSEQVLDVLEDHGFRPVEFVMGPELGPKGP
jgi:hypothetical protein